MHQGYLSFDENDELAKFPALVIEHKQDKTEERAIAQVKIGTNYLSGVVMIKYSSY